MSCDFGGSVDLQRLANKILYYTHSLYSTIVSVIIGERER